MPLLTICAIAAATLQRVDARPQHQQKTVDFRPLGPASRIYVAPTDPKGGISDVDAVRYLNRHAVPAGLLKTLRPLKASVSKVNAVSAMNAVLVVSASPRTTLSVYLFKPSVQPDLRNQAPVWTTVLMSTGPAAVNAGLDNLLTSWRKDHPERKRK